MSLIFFNIDAGPVEDSLHAWFVQADTAINWWPSLPEARTPPVHGWLTRIDAMCRVLRGTGLTFQYAQPGYDFEGKPRQDDDAWSVIVWREGSIDQEDRPVASLAKVCGYPDGWGPDFIEVPKADWK